jgi:hypothetical protein
VDPGALTGRAARGAAGFVLAAGLLAGCVPGGGAAAPEFRPADCPPRITADVLTPVTCGTVRVPERHDDPSGPQIELFVARVLPNTPVSGEPALFLGYNVGGTVEYGSMATLAPRIHREVVIVDLRGTGFSRPHLGCPEVAAVAPEVAALPSGAQAGRAAYRGAVADCFERLTSGGVDVPAYGLGEVADDIRDVMAALDVETAGLFTGGTSSRYLTPLLADAPEGTFRLAVIDDGRLRSVPEGALTAEALDQALAAADALCDAACAQSGVPSERLPALAAELDAAPRRTITGDGTPLVLDGARLRGIAAWWLERHEGGAALAQELADAAAGRPDPGPLFDAERVLCLGNRPKCEAPDFAYGVLWTLQCRDEAAVDPAVAEDVCAQWPVGRSGSDHRALRSSVPVLAMYGGLNPYLRPDGDDLAGVSRRTVVIDPTRGQDVMIGCTRPWRNRWVDDPALEPEGLCPGVAPPVTGTRAWDD